MTYPRLLDTVLDTTEPRELAEFYRQLLGLRYRTGDDSSTDWFVLVDEQGRQLLAFQQVEELARSTWPRHDVPQQLHLDFTVPDAAELERHRARALELGAELRYDRSDDPEEPLYVFADPSGHPFCIFVG